MARAWEPAARGPSSRPGNPRCAFRGGHHPLLADRGRSVGNDVALGLAQGQTRLAVITGSNMGGKSTYLRMTVLLPILAQAGALVPAQVYEGTILRILSSIDIRDHLASGKSLYDAETDRALALIREAQGKGGYLMVMDEILQGTNPQESTAAQWAVMRYLARTRNLFELATHNPKVTELAAEPGIANLHVEEEVKDGKMAFSHKVLPGPAVSRNGLLTLEMKGFPASIVEEARKIVEQNGKR